MVAVSSAIVVGGGISGLVAARAMALRGIDVTLIERKAQIADEGGIGIGVQSNAMNALDEIGLASRCVASGVPVDALLVYSPDGQLVATRPAPRHAGSPWPGFTGMSRAGLHAILMEGAQEAGVRLVTRAEVSDYKYKIRGDCPIVRRAIAIGGIARRL